MVRWDRAFSSSANSPAIEPIEDNSVAETLM